MGAMGTSGLLWIIMSSFVLFNNGVDLMLVK